MVVGLAFAVMRALDIANAAERAFPRLVGGYESLVVIVNVADLGAQCGEVQQRLRIQALEERVEPVGEVLVTGSDVGVTGKMCCWIIGAHLLQIVIALVPMLELIN